MIHSPKQNLVSIETSRSDWKPLHVLDHSLPLNDGYGVRSAAIVTHQRELGWEPIVSTSPHQDPVPCHEIETIDGICYYRIVSPGKRGLPFFHEFRSVRQLIRRLNHIIEQEKPDVVHAHSPCTWAFAALRAARKNNLPFVYEMRGLWQGENSESGRKLKHVIGGYLEDSVIRSADAVVSISSGLRQKLLDRGAMPGRTFVVPNGVRIEQFEPRERDPGLSNLFGLDGLPTVGYLGSLYNWEGLNTFIDAVKELKQSMRFKAFIVGSGPEAEHLEELATERGVNDVLYFTGRVPLADVGRYYSIMDVMVYPRVRNENTESVTPLKPLEAMALSKAIVTSDVKGLLELLPEETCKSFASGDAKQLAERCKEFMENEDLRRGHGESARAHVIATRAWPNLIGEYDNVYATAKEEAARRWH